MEFVHHLISFFAQNFHNLMGRIAVGGRRLARTLYYIVTLVPFGKIPDKVDHVLRRVEAVHRIRHGESIEPRGGNIFAVPVLHFQYPYFGSQGFQLLFYQFTHS